MQLTVPLLQAMVMRLGLSGVGLVALASLVALAATTDWSNDSVVIGTPSDGSSTRAWRPTLTTIPLSSCVVPWIVGSAASREVIPLFTIISDVNVPSWRHTGVRLSSKASMA